MKLYDMQVSGSICLCFAILQREGNNKPSPEMCLLDPEQLAILLIIVVSYKV